MTEQRENQQRMQKKLMEERQAKRELVEDFKFRKEMNKQREQNADNFVTKKAKEKNTTDE